MNNDNVLLLEKALLKAHHNGFRFKGVLTDYDDLFVEPGSLDDRNFTLVLHYPFQEQKINLNLPLLLFDIAFAKALFGDYWDVHLNLLAAAHSPWDYLMNYLGKPTGESNSIPETYEQKLQRG